MIYGRFAPEIPMPNPVPANKQSKIKRVYEDDNWIIDIIDDNLRVSYFEGGHFVDDVTIFRDSF